MFEMDHKDNGKRVPLLNFMPMPKRIEENVFLKEHFIVILMSFVSEFLFCLWAISLTVHFICDKIFRLANLY